MECLPGPIIKYYCPAAFQGTFQARMDGERRVGLRLSALDESLLNDEVVTVEMVTDAPQGSSFVAGAVAEFVEDRREY